MALSQRTVSPQNLELQIATNYFGPFLLTSLLFPSFKKKEGSRIVTVSSTQAKSAPLELDNLQSERRYVPHTGAYAQSKLAALIFALELQRRLTAADSLVASIAAHPGWAVTNLGRSASLGLRIVMRLGRFQFQSAAAGSLPLLFAATSPDAQRGGYYGPNGRSEAKGSPAAAEVPKLAKVETLSRSLWEESERVTDQTFDMTSQA